MKILEIEILTADLTATEKYYTTTLEFVLISRSKDSITLRAGNSSIIFKKTEGISPVYHFAFNIPNNQLNEALFWARERFDCIKTKEGEYIVDFDNWDAKAFYFFDNSGNILEFLARYELNNQSDQHFSSKNVVEVSEMAIVTDHVPTLSERLMKENNIPVFKKQPPHDNFMAMGDDQGLMILSNVGRHWYPTELTAEKFYTRIKVMEKKNVYELVFN